METAAVEDGHPSRDELPNEAQEVAASANVASPQENNDFPYEFVLFDDDEVDFAQLGLSGGRPPLQTAADTFRRDILANFECPYRSPCSMGLYCPFSHPFSISTAHALRTVPPYFCLDSLLATCTGGSDEELSRCPLGFHPTVQDLTDLESFHQKLANALLLSDYAVTPQCTPTSQAPVIGNEPLEADLSVPSCPICLETLPPSPAPGLKLAYLENCVHIFHANCLLDWKSQRATGPGHSQDIGATSSHSDCPECRIESSRILIWPTLFTNDTEKRTTFFEQKTNFGLSIDTEVVLSVAQVDQHQFAVTIDGQAYNLKTKDPPKEKILGGVVKV